MKYNFTKMHGAGNDYVYINCFETEVDDPNALSILLADRHKGIGGDGLVLICPSEAADAKMRMFNLDGSEGMMCGNAIRCVSKFIYDNNIARKDTVTIETKSGIKTISIRSENGRFISASVDMGKAVLIPRDIPMSVDGESFISQPVEAAGKTYLCTAVSMGNPHCITFVDSVDSKINMYSEGPDKIVMAHYTVDGKLYDNVQIFDYPATISEGDIITVYYDPADPGIIIKNPDRGTSLVANIIGLILIVLGFAAIIFGGKASKGRADMKLEERYHPHDNYTGEMTERANTLFDREVSPKEFTPDQDYSKKW